MSNHEHELLRLALPDLHDMRALVRALDPLLALLRTYDPAVRG